MRVARGVGSGKGKTGGRGVKGQKSRSGVAVNGFEGVQMPIYRRLPKRGFNNIFRLQFVEINLGRIQSAIDAGSLDAGKEINAVSLMEAGVIRRSKDGIRILNKGELKSKITIRATGASASAKEAIAKIGGELIIDTIRPGSEKTEEVDSEKKVKKTASKKAKKTTKKEA
ncbi:50S ribosomal protein L15 [bacterium]|nr:50S ribosomal protein L15 [bacterium]